MSSLKYYFGIELSPLKLCRVCEHAPNPWHPTTVPDASHGRPGDGHGRAGIHLVTGTPKGKVTMGQTKDRHTPHWTTWGRHTPHWTTWSRHTPHWTTWSRHTPHWTTWGRHTPHWTTWSRHTPHWTTWGRHCCSSVYMRIALLIANDC